MTTDTSDREVAFLAPLLSRAFDSMFARAQESGDRNTLAGLASIGHRGSLAALASIERVSTLARRDDKRDPLANQVAESGYERQWRAACGRQEELGQRKHAAVICWREGAKQFLAIRCQVYDGQSMSVLLSTEATPAGNDEITAAADALKATFSRTSAGFERLLAALKA